MFNGYMALGGETFDSTRFELVNTGRALAYVEGWNAKILAARFNPDGPPPTACIDWLEGCDDCVTGAEFFSGGSGYMFPETDPAPWYNQYIPGSERFLGVIGLEVKGDEDSTRSAEVTQSIGGGGVVGRLRYAPRTFVVRVLAIAVDSCGMEVGLNWLREQYKGGPENCEGDFLWVLDCCPECAGDVDAPGVGPCWAVNYEELSASAAAGNEIDGGHATSIFADTLDGGTADSTFADTIDGGNATTMYEPNCAAPEDCPPGTWWPCTYADLRDGPTSLDTEVSGWCAWLLYYRDLRRGLPEFSCSVNDCISPYVRIYRTVRVTDGPTILSRRRMNRIGEIAEIEFTIVAADPAEYSPYVPLMGLMVTPIMMVDDEPSTPIMAGGAAFPDAADDKPPPPVKRPGRAEPDVDPFARGQKPRVERRTRLVETPTKWVRHEFSVDPMQTNKLSKFVPRVTLAATGAATGAVRVGLWRDGELLDGFTVPYIPEGGSVQIDGRDRRTITEHDGYEQTRNGFAVGFDGGVLKWPELAFSESGLRVSVDQEFGKDVEGLVAEVAMSAKGSG